MILIDASIWIDHLRADDERLDALLQRNEALIHPFVVGELAMGSIADRERFLQGLWKLPAAVVARDEEVLRFVGSNHLYGTGIGYLDAHLLLSAVLSNAKLWSRDKRLDAAARSLEIAVSSHLH